MIWPSLIVSILMAAGALGWAYALLGTWIPAVVLACVGLIWILAQWRHMTWFASVGLVAFTLVAGFGVWVGLPAGWMLAGVIGGLLAWDLSEFLNRLRGIGEEDRRAISNPHLARLGIMLLVGLTLSSGALMIQVSFTFEWAIFLVLFSVWGISLLVRWYRRRSS